MLAMVTHSSAADTVQVLGTSPYLTMKTISSRILPPTQCWVRNLIQHPCVRLSKRSRVYHSLQFEIEPPKIVTKRRFVLLHRCFIFHWAVITTEQPRRCWNSFVEWSGISCTKVSARPKRAPVWYIRFLTSSMHCFARVKLVNGYDSWSWDRLCVRKQEDNDGT